MATPEQFTTVPTLTASPTVTPTITLTPTRTLTPTPLPAQVYLEPMSHQWQTLNNCHRASIAILLGYYDIWFSQHDFYNGMDILDELVAPYGLTARVYRVRYAVVSTSHAVRWLLAEGIPIIVGQRLSRDDNTWHNRVVHGYNDVVQEFIIDDPLLGPGLRMSYETFDRLSRGIGHVIPVYPVGMDEMIVATMYVFQMQMVTY